MFAMSIIASVGLWFFRRWARLLYLLSVIASVLLTALDGPAVHHVLFAIFSDVSSVITGAIVGVAYFAPIDGLRRAKA
jgi:Na+-translocating ferredoxin:NAD+ oxidoreductase RnfD subunit